MTAELAMVLPLLLAVVVAMTWLLSVGLAQVRTVDAAREAARALARGDDESRAVDLASRVAPAGSRVTVARTDGTVVVTVAGTVTGPGGLLGSLPGAEVSATATALEEQLP
ncbi:TadE family type IV pilus minor pilin [uncultured Nocardioides sp.]|uniref:TadE family type IV pilus minor pilin n=1 Tax=uncultured Nocardioides sp. TaxID=198441 RepID=UPI0030FAE215